MPPHPLGEGERSTVSLRSRGLRENGLTRRCWVSLAAWRIALVLAGLLGVATPGQADYLVGMMAFARGDYRAALAEWRPLAERGQAEAQFNLGVLYDGGLGIERDYAQAADWYRRAAEQGHARAQFNLAVLYADGLGLARNYAEAARWYRQAADQGKAEAQFNLGVLYENGLGVIENRTDAARWYLLAAAQGHTVAQNNLGVLYASGQGIPQNSVAAYAWYDLAAANGNAKARFNRDRLVEILTPEQVLEGQQLSAEYAKRYRRWPSP